jgi:CRP/FNR family transcriptional regulator, anaerobic regulatory protein
MSCHSCSVETDINKICVSKVPIFNDLSLLEMHEVAKVTVQKRFHKKDFIFRAEELSEHLFIIHKGSVKIYRLSDSGKEQIIRILEPGDFAGELSLFTQNDTTCYAEALEETEICMIYQKDIYDLILRHPTISLKILKELSNRLNQTERLIEEVNVQDVEKRTATYLINLASKEAADFSTEPIKVTLPMSKKDLASFIGTSRETLSRKLSAFQHKGWINQSGQRNIIILNYNHLRMIAGD